MTRAPNPRRDIVFVSRWLPASSPLRRRCAGNFRMNRRSRQAEQELRIKIADADEIAKYAWVFKVGLVV